MRLIAVSVCLFVTGLVVAAPASSTTHTDCGFVPGTGSVMVRSFGVHCTTAISVAGRVIRPYRHHVGLVKLHRHIRGLTCRGTVSADLQQFTCRRNHRHYFKVRGLSGER